jgi:hypothetical protein
MLRNGALLVEAITHEMADVLSKNFILTVLQPARCVLDDASDVDIQTLPIDATNGEDVAPDHRCDEH